MVIMNNKTSGFTLIELIMIIVIIGILAAVTVPRFFNFTSRAEQEVEATFIGGLKTGINLFAIDKLLDTGKKTYPAANSPLFNRVLDEIPDDWNYDNTTGLITHTRGDGTTKQWLYSTNSDSTNFNLGLHGGPPPPPIP